MPRPRTLGASVAALASWFLLVVGTSASAMAAPPAADAAAGESKIRCQAAYEHAQQLRRDGRLSAARVELGVCKETCPATLSPDCDRWLREIATLLPTIRVRARSKDGARVRDVRVLVDGKLLADPAPDEPLVVDPGERVLRFEHAGAEPVEVRISLEPGERDHLVEVTVVPTTPPPIAPDLALESPSRAPSYVFAIAGGAALVVAGALAVKGHVDRADLEGTCAPACDPSRADPIRTLWVASAITAGVGVVSLSLAVLLWPRAKTDARATAAIRTEVVPMLGGLGLRGEFR